MRWVNTETAMHKDDSRKWPGSVRLVEVPSQRKPWLLLQFFALSLRLAQFERAGRQYRTGEMYDICRVDRRLNSQKHHCSKTG